MGSNDSSRRTFLRNSLIAGEAAALAFWMGESLLAQAQPAEGRTDGSVFRVGIVGCGRRSGTHIGAINGIPGLEVAALCDLMPHKLDQRARQVRQKTPPRKYTDLEKMLTSERLDAVAVVLPNHLHKMATIAALQAGCHVLCEKPMALTVADCNAMIAAAQRAGRQIQIGTQRRHTPSYRHAIEVIRQAPVGAILSSTINSYRGDWPTLAASERVPGQPYWRLIQEQCGGVVYEMGAHVIDMNNWFFDSEPVTVASLQGVNHPALPKRDSTDHAGVLVRYANGAVMNYGGNLYTRRALADNHFFAADATITLDEKRMEIDYGRSATASGKDAKGPTSITLPTGNGNNDQWRHFAKVLAGEAKAYPDGHSGRQTIQICEGAVVSSRDGTIVRVKDLG